MSIEIPVVELVEGGVDEKIARIHNVVAYHLGIDDCDEVLLMPRGLIAVGDSDPEHIGIVLRWAWVLVFLDPSPDTISEIAVDTPAIVEDGPAASSVLPKLDQLLFAE